MKKIVSVLLAIALSLSMTACTAVGAEYEKFTMSFFGAFDTVIQILGYAKEQSTFERVTAEAQAQFEHLHTVYDAYNAYEGVQNVFALNRDGAKAPVKVEPELMELLLYARDKQQNTQGTVNFAMGAVLSIWHEYRDNAEANPQNAAVPPMDMLKKASEHTDFANITIDEANGTVFFEDPALRIDVGSVAKGYATEQVAQWMLQSDMPSFIISAGGNVRAGEKPLDGRETWVVSVQNPDAPTGFLANQSEMLDKLLVTNTSVVTSGDYERYFTVDGERYHHIISPDTLMPAKEMRAVTVVCEDSGLADVLSTAFFILPYAEGLSFAQSLDGVEVLWVLADGAIQMTEGMAVLSVNVRDAGK